jgi:hypothetical protein
MSDLFFLFGILALLFEVAILVRPRHYRDTLDDYSTVLKAGNVSEITEDGQLRYPNYIWLTFLLLGYTGWLFVGLITYQWFAFLVFISVDLVYGIIFNNRKKPVWSKFTNALISSALLVFIIVNHFNYRLNYSDIVDYLF